MNSLFKGVLISTLLFLASITHASSLNEVTFNDTSGEKIRFFDENGKWAIKKWVIINYWASWCDSCRAEIPELNRFYNSHKDVVFLGVNSDSLPAEEQKALNRELDIQYPVLLQNPAQTLKLGSIAGIPATFIFNPEGKLVQRIYGDLTCKKLNNIIEKDKV